MFRVKICGITSVDDALAVARVGADAVGLNFYRRSPRYVMADTARDIIAALPEGIAKVGLFVDTPPPDVCRLFDDLGLDLIQLHGDQPPEFIAQLAGRPVMRAFRIGAEGIDPVVDYLARCRALAASPMLSLLDSMVVGEYGGTGQTADWHAAKQYAAEPNVPPLVLAGGLTPENVAAAIRAVRPAAVDVASGVESQPGRKDHAAIAAFVEAARGAFDA
jgi:phosphoribosylanthranilate isomerase